MSASDLRRLAAPLVGLAILLFLASLLPGFGRGPAVTVKLPRGFELLSQQPLHYPNHPSAFGYEVEFRPKRRFDGLSYSVTCDAPIIKSTSTILQSSEGELLGWWGVDPIRRSGSSVEFEFGAPAVDPGFKLSVGVDTSSPITSLRIHSLRSGGRGRWPEALDIKPVMPPGR